MATSKVNTLFTPVAKEKSKLLLPVSYLFKVVNRFQTYSSRKCVSALCHVFVVILISVCDWVGQCCQNETKEIVNSYL